MTYKLIVFLVQLNEYVIEYGCDEAKAGFQNHFYLLPMINSKHKV